MVKVNRLLRPISNRIDAIEETERVSRRLAQSPHFLRNLQLAHGDSHGSGGSDPATGMISDAAYDASTWNGVTDEAASKNALRDQIEVMVDKADFDAQSILAATNDNTPAALVVAEQEVVGRLTGGNVDGITIGIADNGMVQVDGSPNDDEYARFTANGLEGRTYAEVLSDISAASISSATTSIYVDASATGSADGTSWTNAYTTIQAAWDSLPDIVAHAYTIYVRRTKTTIEDCEDAWTDATGGNVTCSAIADDGTAYARVGTNCAKNEVAAGAGVELLVYEDISSANLSAYTDVVFWFYSTVALAEGDFQFCLDNSTGCGSPLETLDLPAIVADKWTRVSLAFSTPGNLTAVQSLGITQAVDKGALDFYIDHVEASYVYREEVNVDSKFVLNSVSIESEYYAGGECDSAPGGNNRLADASYNFTTGGDAVWQGALVVLFDRTGANNRVTDYYLTTVKSVDPDGDNTGELELGDAWQASTAGYVDITPTDEWFYFICDAEVSASDDGTEGGTARDNCFDLISVDNITINGFHMTFSDDGAVTLFNSRNNSVGYSMLYICDRGCHVRDQSKLNIDYCYIESGQYQAIFVLDNSTVTGNYVIFMSPGHKAQIVTASASSLILYFYIDTSSEGCTSQYHSMARVYYGTISANVTTGLKVANNSAIKISGVTNNAGTARTPAVDDATNGAIE